MFPRDEKRLAILGLSLFVFLSGLCPRIAAANVPSFSLDELTITGLGSFPAIPAGPPAVGIPFSFSAPPGETILEVNAGLPLGAPPGAPPLLYSLSARTAVELDGNDVVQRSTFDIQCTFPVGCGNTFVSFTSRGSMTTAGGTITNVRSSFTDLVYVSTGSTPLPVRLSADGFLSPPGGGAITAWSQSSDVELFPGLPASYDLGGGTPPLSGAHEFQAQLNMELTDLGPDFGIASRHTFELRFTIAPAIPEPEIYAMMLAGLGLVGWAARRRNRAVRAR